MNTFKDYYTWAVLRNESILGYIRHQDEDAAKEIAQVNFGFPIEIQKIYLVGIVPEGKEVWIP
jgi:hypothetical protein